MPTYYVSTTGSDVAAGTLAAPYATLQKAHDVSVAGDTIYMRGGTYTLTAMVTITINGSSGNTIKVYNYPGEVPVIDGGSLTNQNDSNIKATSASWWHFKGLETKNAPSYGINLTGASTNNIIEACNAHRNVRLRSSGGGNGILVDGTSSNNLVLNCDAHHNGYPLVSASAGDGIGVNFTTGAGNILRGNRCWRNNDDGIDLWDAANVLVENNWCWENGYDDTLTPSGGNGTGFKLGGGGTGDGAHTVRNNLSWRNLSNGFDDNSANLAMTVYNNTAWENVGVNYGFFAAVANVLKNNLGLPSADNNIHASVLHTFNAWNLGVTVSSADFASLDFGNAVGARQNDGSLPTNEFLKLVSGSDLINVGTEVGIAYSGSAPDLGAYEFPTPGLAGVDRGTGTHNTSATTFTAVPASNFRAGMAVMVISADNAGTNGAAFTTFTVTDTNSNTWTRRASPLYDPGAASAGVEGGIFTTLQNGGLLETTDTITVTFNNNTTAKAWTLMEVVGVNGTPNFVAGGVGIGAAGTGFSVTTGSVTNGDMVIGACFNEHGTAQTPTGDSDTTNGSWSTMQTTEIGTTAAGQTVISQRKVVTADGTQVYNITLGVSSDAILAWIQIIEGGLVNLFDATEQFNDAAWTKTNATITADVVTTAPTGGLVADKLVETSDGSPLVHLVKRMPASAANTVYTVSIYAKAAERTCARIRAYDNGSNFYGSYVNLTTGTRYTASTGGTVNFTGWSVVDAGNGWWRLSATVSQATTVLGLEINPVDPPDGGGDGYTGNGTSGIYIWGAQLERGELSAYKKVPADLPSHRPLPHRAPILAQ